jgi:aminocarboxymuconate-semialdehyde decarboxylase
MLFALSFSHPLLIREDGLEISRFINDDIAESVEKGQKRFLGLGTLPMQDPELAILEMQRCKKDLGLSGIEIGTHINKWNLGHKDLFQFFVEAEKLEMSLFIHPWEMMGQDRMPEYWLPWLVGMPAETSLAICSLIFSGVMEKLPNLKLAFAHGGGSFPGTIGRIDHGFNTRPDLCAKDNNIKPSSYLGKFFVDSLTHDEKALANLVELFGEDKILMGSDYPFPLGEAHPGELIENSSKLTKKQKNKMLCDNTLAWLGTTAEQVFGD